MRYVFGDYELDTQRYELRHAGTPCALEPQAFNVLLYLVQHRDRVVPKDELLEHIWPQQYISEAVLSQRLMFVRRAVGDSGSQQRVIKTMHRRGYRFVAPVEERPEVGAGQDTPPAPLSPTLPSASPERTVPGELAPGGLPLQCPQCQHANPAGAKFCNACAMPLQGGCPACGTANPPGARFCYQCATPLTGTPPGTPRPPEPRAYTPAYLSEKILASRAALEGERKQVTVLFADMTGSLALIAGLDPEEAKQRLDPVLRLMLEAVHRYEGTVHQVLGDGIMALFGAPVAHEDHALRACYAALAMQAALHRYEEEVRRTQGLSVHIRIGLNAGDVVVQAIGNDLSMDYRVVGQTVHLAARMEQMATPGSILLPVDTYRLVEGLVRVNTMGPVAIKGLTEPVEVCTLLSATAAQPRWRAAGTQGLPRFIGRHLELQALGEALARTVSEHGQLVAVSGEAGLGKSRLLYEFSHGPLTEGWRVLEVGAMSYGQATPYLPIRDLLRAYCGIDAQDDENTIREKVDKHLRWDTAPHELRPIVLALLDVAVDAPEWQQLEPPQRRWRIIESVKRLLLRQSQAQPLLVVMENLHWIDAGTQAVLDSLIDSLPAGRLLLLVSYRPEYQHDWGQKTYYTLLRLHALAPKAAEELLDVLVGQADTLRPVKHLLLARSEGNPFFLEESVRSLVETQVLRGERGAYHLAKPLTRLRVPATVQAILAARMDRLPPAEKRLLQSAAVMGREIPLSLLQALTETPEDDLRRGLAHLQQAEFLVETRLYPELVYAFTHALTHDVAYASLLRQQRRELHARIVAAIERLWAERLSTQVEQLAHHAVRGELWDKALVYCREAGHKAGLRSAHRVAVECFEQALEALQRLPETSETMAQAVALHFEARNALLPLGEHERLFEHLRSAETLVRRLHDPRRLGQTLAYLAEHFRQTGDLARAVDSGEQALALATELEDFALKIMATCFLGTSYSALGEYQRAADAFSRNVAVLTGELGRERFGMSGLPAVLSRTWLVSCLADLGAFDDGIVRGNEAVQMAEAAEHPFSLVQAYQALGTLFLHRGELSKATPVLQRGLALCQGGGIVTWFPTVAAALGYAYTLAGRMDEALPLLQQAVTQEPSQNLSAGYARRLAYLSEAALLAGRRDEATALATQALMCARGLQARGIEAYALWLHGEIQAHQASPAGDEAAEASYQQALALAKGLGMRPLQARCTLALGTLATRRGQFTQARADLASAMALFEAMGMTFWLPRAQALLAQAGGEGL